MHYSSMVKMGEFAAKYFKKGMTVVDVGSYDINGSYKEIFKKGKYIGADIRKGPNVDIVIGSKSWKDIKDVDVVISGQTLEHVKDVDGLMAEIYGIVKKKGVICMITPSAGPPHNYPEWYGNFSEERMRDVVEKAGFKVLSIEIHPVGPCHDNCCIAVKE